MISKKKPSAPAPKGDFESLVLSIVQIHQQAQDFATKAVNVGLTLRNWLIGWHIEEYDRQGADRATYGDKLMETLAKRLALQGWKRCDRRELYRFRQLYLIYPKIVECGVTDSTILPQTRAAATLGPSPTRIRINSGVTDSRISDYGVTDSTIDLSTLLHPPRRTAGAPR